MKKISSAIIATIILFSSISPLNASNWVLGNLLEIRTGVENYKMDSIPGLSPQSFSNSEVQRTYNEFIKVDQALRAEFIKQYNTGYITDYQMQDLVNNYGNFVYYTNKTFEYIAFEERGIRGKETQRAIEGSYTKMRTYYMRVQHILSR